LLEFGAEAVLREGVPPHPRIAAEFEEGIIAHDGVAAGADGEQAASITDGGFIERGGVLPEGRIGGYVEDAHLSVLSSIWS